MCGIVGVAGEHDPIWVRRMSAVLAHRGPDDHGVYHDPAGRVSLANRRLSIIDVEGGHQPMANEDGTLWVVFNGEIYNAPALRKRVQDRGHQLRTANADTEVLLHLYEDEGEEFLGRLNGMFAFVLYDAQRRQLFGARDRLGIKPLYYSAQPGRFAFASELKALLALPGMSRDVDRASVFHYMSLKYLPADRSIFQEIRRLPPGHWFRYDLASKRLTIQRYWQLSFVPEQGLSEAEWAQRLRETLRQATRRWTRSDVPIGCALSGGLDSAAVLGLAAEAGCLSLRTYALGVEGWPESVAELDLARETARRWGTEHHEWRVSPSELLDDLIPMVWHLDEPYGGGLPSWFVFKLLRRHVKVALTGTGGDELFGSYGKFHLLEARPLGRWVRQLRDGVADWRSGVRPLPALRGGERRRGKSLFQAFYFERMYYAADDIKRRLVFGRWAREIEDSSGMLEAIYKRTPSEAVRDRVAHLDFSTQLAEEFLLVTDRFSMAHSVEARVPLLDHEVVETVFRVPASLRTHPRDLKRLFRHSVADLVPASVQAAPKRGFVLPTGAWLRGPLRGLAETLLDPARLERQEFFQPAFYTEVVRPHLAGEADAADLVWTALMFQLWHVVFIEEEAVEAPVFTWQALCSRGARVHATGSA